VGVYQQHKTSTKEEDKISYCHKCLKSLYYLNKWGFKMNNYSLLSKCFEFSFISTEKILTPKNFVGPLVKKIVKFYP
jgi:hypothetical protein